MYGLVYTLIATAMVAGAGAILVRRINRKRIQEEAERQRQRNEIAARINNIYKSGEYNTVRIGLLDHNLNETQEIKIEGQEVESNLSVGDVIYLT